MTLKIAQSIPEMPTHSTLAERIRWLRTSKGLSVQEFACRVDCDPGYISKLEHGKALNPSMRFFTRAAVALRLNGEWIRTGKGAPFYDVSGDERTKKHLPNWSKERLQRVISILDELPEALATDEVVGHLLRSKTLEEIQELWQEVRSLELPATARLFWNMVFMKSQIPKWGQDAPKNDLTHAAIPLTSSVVKTSQLPGLLERLNQATSEAGAKSELAEYLGVPLASVSRWLSGSREPGGEVTLRLQKWIEEEESKQKQTAGSVTARPAAQTQTKGSHEKKPKPSPPKK